MSSSFLEIVELEEGGFALKRVDSDDESLVTVSFSAEVKEHLKEHEISVAKAMISAGIRAVGELSKANVSDDNTREQTIH